MDKKEAIERLKALRDLEISAFREAREFNFVDEKAMQNWRCTKRETIDAYNTAIKFVEQLDEPSEKECNMLFVEFYQHDISKCTAIFSCDKCGEYSHTHSTSDIPKFNGHFCPNCGAKIRSKK